MGVHVFQCVSVSIDMHPCLAMCLHVCKWCLCLSMWLSLSARCYRVCGLHGIQTGATVCGLHGIQPSATVCVLHGIQPSATVYGLHGIQPSSTVCGLHGIQPGATEFVGCMGFSLVLQTFWTASIPLGRKLNPRFSIAEEAVALMEIALCQTVILKD